MTFEIGQVIFINRKKFEITKIGNVAGPDALVGTLEGDPSFLAGSRTVIPNELTPTSWSAKVKAFEYDWSAV